MQARRIINMLAVATIVVGTTTACATKKFVRTEVGGVNTRVETLSQSIEATQQETRANQARIGEVDKKTDQVGIWAKDAQTSAATANTAAAAVADATNLSPAPTVSTASGTDAAGRPYVEVTAAYTFRTITGLPGVPNAVNLTRKVRMNVSASSPN